ncbi:MAG: hypothetical protein ACRDZX_10835, partial [Acidimicrobiales bacterium]
RWEGDWDPTRAGAWEEQGPDAEDGAWEGYEDGAYEAGYVPDAGYPGYARSREEVLAAYGEGYSTSALPQTWARPRGPGHGRRRRRANGPWPELVMVAAVAVIIAAAVLAVTTANRSRLTGAGAGNQGSLSSAPGSHPGGAGPAPATGRSPSTRPTTSSTRPVNTGIPPVSRRAKNLFANAEVKQALVRSWLASNPGAAGLRLGDVAGLAPGQLYYAYQPGPGTYWALAVFQPSAELISKASSATARQALALFKRHDYAFSWQPGSSHDWTLLGETSAGRCPGVWVPTQVLAVWGLCDLKPPAKGGSG